MSTYPQEPRQATNAEPGYDQPLYEQPLYGQPAPGQPAHQQSSQNPNGAPAQYGQSAQDPYGHPMYGQPPVMQPRTVGTNALAIVAFVTSLVGMAIIPVIFGHIALGQIRKTGEQGTVFAIIGLVFGYLQIIGYVVAALLFFGVLGIGIWAST